MTKLVKRGLDNIRLPDLQPLLQLTDRADGTIWTLVHRQSDARIGLSDEPVLPVIAGHIRRFAAFDEPFLTTDRRIRILVRGGQLGYEMASSDARAGVRSQVPLLSRAAFEHYALEIFKGDFGQPGDPIGWRTREDLFT